MHAWSLNAGKGLPLPGGFRLRAAMQYEFLRDEAAEGGPWRCTTRGYMYAVEGRNPETREEQELIAYHWHRRVQAITGLPTCISVRTHWLRLESSRPGLICQVVGSLLRASCAC